MGRRIAVGILVVAVVAAACGSGAGNGPDGSGGWASEADAVVAEMAEAYDAADAYSTARFYSAGGTLDLGIGDNRGVATTPAEVIEAVEQLWFQRPGFADVDAEHLFVTPDGVVVWWFAYTGDGFQNFVQSYFFGSRGRVASRTFRAIEVPFENVQFGEDVVLDLADLYLDAWAARTRDDLEAVYTPDVVVRDDVAGWEWRGIDEVVAGAAEAAPVERGPWPRVFVYRTGNTFDAILLFQLGGECPRLEARRWALDGTRIVREVRFTHVPSARRCPVDGELPDGWWNEFVLPPELEDNVTEVVDTAGSLVELVNAEPTHEEYARWLFDRYTSSGIGLPEVAAVWLPPAPECTELGGLAIESDERYEGRHTVVVCYTEDRLTSDDSESGWSPVAIAYGLHELAHIWMVDHLTDGTRSAFNDMAGLTVWRGPEAEWRERGVEHAAFTIAWGLAGAEDARYPILPPPECEELAARYELLTGRTPLTACGEGGWSP
jgi:hypothetical protein